MTEEFIYEGGWLYRVVTYQSGTVIWHLNDKIHREKGPAITSWNGTLYWYQNGKRINNKQKSLIDKLVLNNG